jgi:hypothetical protein
MDLLFLEGIIVEHVDLLRDEEFVLFVRRFVMLVMMSLKIPNSESFIGIYTNLQ